MNSASSVNLLSFFLTTQAVLSISFYTFLFAAYGNSSNIVVTLVWLALGFLFSIKERGLGFGSTRSYFVLLGFLAPLNIIFSDNIAEVSMRWCGLFVLIKVIDWVSSRDLEQFMFVIFRFVPWLICCLMVADFVHLYLNPLPTGRVASHTTSIYANLLFVFSICMLPRLRSLVWILISIVAVYYSGSRGALVSLGLTLFVYAVLLLYVRRYLLGSCLVASLSVLAAFYDKIIVLFSGAKVAEGVDAMESAMKSGEGRVELASLVWSQVMEQPLLGNGFQKFLFYLDGQSLESHTGHVTLFLYLGVPMAFFVFIYFIYGFFVIMTSGISRRLKMFYFLVFFVFNLRSSVEPITLFDIGNLFVFYFLIIHFCFYYNSRGSTHSLRLA